jgi:hypothetical protein
MWQRNVDTKKERLEQNSSGWDEIFKLHAFKSSTHIVPYWTSHQTAGITTYSHRNL